MICKYKPNRLRYVNNDRFLDILMEQNKSISPNVTYSSLKICRQLAKDEESLVKLQGDKLRLSKNLIQSFRWFEQKILI